MHPVQKAFMELILILHHVSKRKNVHMLLEVASSFHIKCVYLVGQEKNKALITDWCLQYDIVLFECCTLLQAKGAIHEKHKATIFGIEILPQAMNVLGNKTLTVSSSPFTGSSAILMGNEGSGMSKSQMEICDEFLYIPQYGGGTASLNVTVAASIIFYRFTVWAQEQELKKMEIIDKKENMLNE